MMRKSQILSLFICSLVPWTVGNGLVPLLPVYATRLGADAAIAGYYMAFSYLAIAVGAISAGWISDKTQHRKIPIIIAGLSGIPLAWLMGHAANIWILALLTAFLWFFGGLGLAMIGILTGLSAGEGERGKIFGILSLTAGLGSSLGSLATGFMVERWGFQRMFEITALFILLWPLSGLFLTEKVVDPTRTDHEPARRQVVLGKNFSLLFSASLVASIAAFIVLFGRSLLMDEMEFGPFEISSTGAVSGLFAMPLPLLMGWLSDRKGRKIFLYLGYLIGIIALAILTVSSSLWHFMVVLALQAIFTGVTASVGNALVTDLVPPELLGRGLALFGATGWIGGVLGFAGAGYTFYILGPLPTFIMAMCLPLIAIVILIPVRSRAGGPALS